MYVMALNISNETKSCPCVFIKHHAMKTCKGMEVQLQAFLTSALDEAESLTEPR
jgi:hypothetical protein